MKHIQIESFQRQPGNEREIFVHFIGFPEITLGSKRIYDSVPWGISKDLSLPKLTAKGELPYYTDDDEVSIAARLFEYCSRVLKFPNTKRARTVADKAMLKDDKRISGNFINMNNSLRLNLTPGSGSPSPLNIGNIRSHCFFYSSSQTVSMVETLVSYTDSLPDSERTALKKHMTNKQSHVFDDTTFDPIEKKLLYDWSLRLGAVLKQFIEGQKSLFNKKKNDPNAQVRSGSTTLSQSEQVGGNRVGVYTIYFTYSLYSLLKLIRNLKVHWDELMCALKQELCGSDNYNATSFIKYFSIRYPGLFLTVYEITALQDISNFPCNPKIRALPIYGYAKQGKDYKITETEYVSEEDIITETNKSRLDSCAEL